MNDTTVIYYTCNHEDEVFESHIRAVLLRMCKGLPIISVSQRPIVFGENICVGDVGANDHNIYQQILIGCRAVTTPFVVLAEADNLYPEAYFSFIPPDENAVYRYEPIYVLKLHRSYFFRKPTCEGAQIAGREYLIDLIEKEIGVNPSWSSTQYKVNPYSVLERQWKTYTSDIPVVSIKTGNGLRGNTRTEKLGVKCLPYWGSSKTVRSKLS
jgi:hypothetical protein